MLALSTTGMEWTLPCFAGHEPLRLDVLAHFKVDASINHHHTAFAYPLSSYLYRVMKNILLTLIL